MAGSVALASNQMFRGESVSRDDPGVSLAFAADGPAGFYAGADVALSIGQGTLHANSSSQYVGVAHRFGATSVEIGGVHRHYRDNVDTDYDPDYTEAYIGISRGHARLRAYVSHDYNREHKLTGYLELESRLATLGQWSLHGHGGLTFTPQDPGATTRFPRIYEDWSLTVSRPISGFTVALGLASSNYPVVSDSGLTRVSVQISRSF